MRRFYEVFTRACETEQANGAKLVVLYNVDPETRSAYPVCCAETWQDTIERKLQARGVGKSLCATVSDETYRSIQALATRPAYNYADFWTPRVPTKTGATA